MTLLRNAVSRQIGGMPATDLRETVDAVWRMEAAKIVATLTRAVGDVGSPKTWRRKRSSTR